MKKLLITGFDPFGGQNINPSWEAVKRLPEEIGEYTVWKLQIPTVFDLAAQTVLEKAKEVCPDVIISVGQAGSRGAVTPERVGINIRDARIPDNQGNQPEDVPVVSDGPAAWFSTLPVKAMVENIKAEGLPGAVSNTAGTFVCNDVLYTLLHHYQGTGVRCGFIHVPWLPEQGSPNMPLEDIVAALTACIRAL